MSGTATPSDKPSGKREVRILMLHGYTQSGPLFRAKTRALEKLLAKHLAPQNLVPALFYPTGPNQLRPSDIPGYTPPSDGSSPSDDEPADSWAWWRKDEASGRYRFLKEGMLSLAAFLSDLRKENPPASSDAPTIDGVVGFSQGGCLAGLLAAAMETERAVPGYSGEGADYEWKEWVPALREANGGHGLKFSVVYSGFKAPGKEFGWLYSGPKVQTPTMHYIGSLDTAVEESRCRALVDVCEGAVVVVHPGGHFVPVSRDWAGPVAGFVAKYAGVEGKGPGKL